jgi:hypothetical protein
MPLPLVLSRADLHITDCSSVVIEAGWFGIKSALLNSHMHVGQRYEHVYAHERRVGLADALTHDAKGIQAWIADSLAAPKQPRPAPHYRDAVSEFVDQMAARCCQAGAALQVA